VKADSRVLLEGRWDKIGGGEKREEWAMAVDVAGLIKAALVREVEGLRDDIRKLVEPLNEQQFWARPVRPSNSAGHLILHLAGNLNHFVGAQLGGTGYVRDREREFTEANPPAKAVALAGLDAAVATFARVVQQLSPDQLAASHPEAKWGDVVNTLVHLTAHFAVHRGQISYIARLVRPEE
jgi:uncharacterized damage-inducible protein DinB